jgi:hypothetical protein
MTAQQIQKHIRQFSNREKAKILRGFFKTGPGEYGDGDTFLGIQVPTIRQVAKKFRGTPLNEIKKLIKSPIHEERLLALLMLVQLYTEGDDVL